MAVMPSPPRPLITEAAQPFWDALRDSRVVMQRCGACATWVWYPRERCTTCLSADLRWTEVSGQATLYTYTVARAPTMAAFAGDDPQLLAVVELAVGPRMTSTLVGLTADAIRIGMPLSPVFDHGVDGFTLLRYRPTG